MILDVFDVLMFTNIGGKGWVKKIRMLGATNVGAYKRWASTEAIHGFGSFCYKRWVLQTLGLSEARYFMGINVFIYKRWASEARYFMGLNVFIYKRWASPRPGISWV